MGCGTGTIASRVAAALPQAQLYAVDVDEHLLDYARTAHAAPRITWCQAIPKDLDQLGGAYSVDVIHHLDDRPGVFNTLSDAMRPGAIWAVVEPNIWHPVIFLQQEWMRRADIGEDHFRPWVVEAEFRRAGFRIEGRSYAHLWPAALHRPPRWAAAAERRLEGRRHLGGSVVYRLRRI
jgi:trans-aconitate methyltransferase